MALLLAEKIIVLKKYANFLDVFFIKSAVVLFNCLDINKYAIELELGKQLFNRPIYSLGLIELKIFKTYIKINLATRFIQSSTFFTKIPIYFVLK